MGICGLFFITLCALHVSCCVSYTNFVFGDSIVDAGNNNYLPSLSKADYSPYGIDFTPSGGKPTGRYTNGFTIVDIVGNEDDEDFRPWRRRLLSAMKMKVSFAFTWSSAVRAFMFLTLLGTFAFACFSLPIEKILKNFLLWIKEELGPWGPLVLAIAHIPLTVFAVPASVLTIVLLLRFVPLLPFNVLNYLLSVTPVHLWEYMLATWLGMMPITFMFVYIGTTLKDRSDITHGWHEISKTRWMFMALGLTISAQALGAKTLPSPSLSANAASHATLGGINYASGASGILDGTGSLFVGRLPLRTQIDYFEVTRAEMVRKMGENGTQEFLKNAIFSLTTGSNDIITYFLPNLPFVGNYDVSPTTLQDIMVSNMTLNLKRLHKLGARKVFVVDIGPLGCIPFVRSIHFLPAGKCHEEMNTLIGGYNQKLRTAVHGLNQEMGSGSVFVYANSYGIIHGILQNYRDYGFENVNDPCCGDFFPLSFCLRIGDENEISTSICDDRSKYLFWDSYHPGESANFIIAQHMLDGDENTCYPLNVRQLHNHKL